MANHLAGSASPYLLQHANNPVDWYPWGPEALARAREEDRPIFLSIGYSACHWCHVMAHESFEDPAIAARLNAGFIPIKVDREERPDLDDVYLGAVQAMTGSGGWPLSVFLTPDLEPFYGGTYFPPEDRHGLPAFGRVLDALAEAWTSQRSEVSRSAAEIAGHLRHQVEVAPGTGGFDQLPLEAATRRLLGLFDPVNGGFGGAPKFPAPMVLEFLLRRWARDRDPGLLRPVTVTLDRMADGGIHDLLGGGFARYSTDERWLVPHFEKMLYDNALLAHAYLEGHRVTGDPRYAAVARSTLGFLVAEMQTDGGGFAAALDADSEGEEGRFYTWQAAEIDSALRDAGLSDGEIETVSHAWDIRPAGNWEGRTILHRMPGTDVSEALAERARTALLAVRNLRVRPGRDGKQLAAWNGMTLRAFAHGALVLGDPELATATARLVAFIRTELVHDGDRLWRLPPAEAGPSTAGFAEDYALVADGLLEAYAVLGDASCLDLAAALAARLLAGFWDEEAGLLRDTGAEHEALIAQPRSVIDSATPSGNAVAADVLLRLAVLTSDQTLDRRARRILSATAGAWAGQPTMFGRTLAAADRALAEAIDVVVVAEPDDPGGLALRRAAAAVYAPNLVIAGLAPADERTEPLFEGKTAIAGAATAYVCRGSLCLAPTGDPDAVAEQIRSLGAPGSEPA